MTDLKDLVKPPFANYDLVVYFGTGLFALPLISRYICEPLTIQLPQFYVSKDGDVVGEIVRFLTIAFSVYILGHLIAFLSSQTIEKTFDRFFGKVSSAIRLSAGSSSAGRNEAMRALFYDRVRNIRSDGAIFTSVVRAVFHFPLLIHYSTIFVLGIFGYYDTRVPQTVMSKVRTKYANLLMPGDHVSIRTKWYKNVEYFVINRCPDAVQRMYNYLIIAGLFRSLAFVFLFASWLMIYYLTHWLLDGHWLLAPSIIPPVRFSGLIELAILTSASVFCSVCYIKFQRRYAEEAIFAFVFNKNAELSSPL